MRQGEAVTGGDGAREDGDCEEMAEVPAFVRSDRQLALPSRRHRSKSWDMKDDRKRWGLGEWGRDELFPIDERVLR